MSTEATPKTANITHLERYAKLAAEKAALEDQLRTVKRKLAQLEDPVLAYFQAHSMGKVSVAGHTLYLRRDLYAGKREGVSSADAIAALEAAGLTEYAGKRVNWQGLSAWFREREAEGEEIPAEIASHFEPKEVFRIGSRRS